MKNKRFEECFLQYKNLIIRIVMSQTGDYQVAQEICQQVFFSFYISMDRIVPELVKSWLIRSTNNAIIDYFRKNNKKGPVIIETSLAEEGNLLVEESVERYEEKRSNLELAGRILKEVRKVNEQWFEVLMMYCVDGLTYAEVAEKLKISESVVKVRIYRARLYIREKFGDEYLNR